jgi:hypothetical protein
MLGELGREGEAGAENEAGAAEEPESSCSKGYSNILEI